MSNLDKSAKEKLQMFSRIHSELTMLEERVKETKDFMLKMELELRELVGARECEKLGLAIHSEKASLILMRALSRVCGIRESAIEYKRLMGFAISDSCSRTWFNGIAYGNDIVVLCWILQNKRLLKCGTVASLRDAEFEELNTFYTDVRETAIKLTRPYMTDRYIMEALNG